MPLSRSRNFDVDYQRLMGSDVADSTVYGNAAHFTEGAEQRPGATAPAFGGAPAVGSGPLAPRIVDEALRRYRDPALRPTSLYNPSGPRIACASFVSEVLKSVGAFQHGGHFNRSAQLLTDEVRLAGAVQVVPRNTPLTEENISARLLPGDLIFFHQGGDSFHHVAIYVGGGFEVDTSSSEGLVEYRSPTALRRTYAFFAAYRF